MNKYEPFFLICKIVLKDNGLFKAKIMTMYCGVYSSVEVKWHDTVT